MIFLSSVTSLLARCGLALGLWGWEGVRGGDSVSPTRAVEHLSVQPTFFSAVVPRRLVDSARDFDPARGLDPALDFERDLVRDLDLPLEPRLVVSPRRLPPPPPADRGFDRERLWWPPPLLLRTGVWDRPRCEEALRWGRPVEPLLP
ncbi:hypothetical protein MTO96_036544 [Rhipicephalus appendiculatus]